MFLPLISAVFAVDAHAGPDEKFASALQAAADTMIAVAIKLDAITAAVNRASQLPSDDQVSKSAGGSGATGSGTSSHNSISSAMNQMQQATHNPLQSALQTAQKQAGGSPVHDAARSAMTEMQKAGGTGGASSAHDPVQSAMGAMQQSGGAGGGLAQDAGNTLEQATGGAGGSAAGSASSSHNGISSAMNQMQQATHDVLRSATQTAQKQAGGSAVHEAARSAMTEMQKAGGTGGASSAHDPVQSAMGAMQQSGGAGGGLAQDAGNTLEQATGGAGGSAAGSGSSSHNGISSAMNQMQQATHDVLRSATQTAQKQAGGSAVHEAARSAMTTVQKAGGTGGGLTQDAVQQTRQAGGTSVHETASSAMTTMQKAGGAGTAATLPGGELSLKMQMTMESLSKAMQTQTNIQKTTTETSRAIVINMKGSEPGPNPSAPESSQADIQQLVARRGEAVALATSVVEKLGAQQPKILRSLAAEGESSRSTGAPDGSFEAMIGVAAAIANADTRQDIKKMADAIAAAKAAAAAQMVAALVSAAKAPVPLESSGSAQSATSLEGALLLAFHTVTQKLNDELQSLQEQMYLASDTRKSLREATAKLDELMKGAKSSNERDDLMRQKEAMLSADQAVRAAISGSDDGSPADPLAAALRRGSKSGIRQAANAMDIMAVVMAVLRDSYLESQQDLKAYAAKVKQLNEQKKAVRDAILRLREANEHLRKAATHADIAIDGAVLDLGMGIVGKYLDGTRSDVIQGKALDDLWSVLLAYLKMAAKEAREDRKNAQRGPAVQASKAKVTIPTPEEIEAERQRREALRLLKDLKAQANRLKQGIIALEEAIAEAQGKCAEAKAESAKIAAGAATAGAGAIIGGFFGGPAGVMLGAVAGAALAGGGGSSPDLAEPEPCKELVRLMRELGYLKMQLAAIQDAIKQVLADIEREERRKSAAAVGRTKIETKTPTSAATANTARAGKTKAVEPEGVVRKKASGDVPCGGPTNPCKKKTRSLLTGGLLEGGGSGFAAQGPAASGSLSTGGGGFVGGGGVSVDYGGCASCGVSAGSGGIFLK